MDEKRKQVRENIEPNTLDSLRKIVERKGLEGPGQDMRFFRICEGVLLIGGIILGYANLWVIRNRGWSYWIQIWLDSSITVPLIFFLIVWGAFGVMRYDMDHTRWSQKIKVEADQWLKRELKKEERG
ncbi:MAG: hypothetical protein ACE5I5_16295 [Candidatus Heimdallarchaeota archaeon]